jgi:hypothetical protein
MNAVVQSLIVFVIVATAAIYATVKFMPAAWRRSFAAHAATWATRSGLSDVTARRVEAKLSSGGACGSCDSCKACATTPPQKQEGEVAASVTTSPSNHYRQIPIRRAS